MKNNPIHKLIVENWGPVEKGEIEFKPLTILIGPNNTGKSYISMLYYALMRSFKKALATSTIDLFESDLELLISNIIYSSNRARELKNRGNLVGKILDETKKILSSTLLKNEIERIFSDEIGRLVRIGAESSKIRLYINYRGVGVRINVIIHRDNSINVDIDFKMPRELVEQSQFNILREILNATEGDIYYLPASRAGIIHSYKSVASALVRLAPLAAVRGAEVPRFPGPLADFISELISIELKRVKEAKKDIVKHMNKIIEGEVILEKIGEEVPPEIYYVLDGSRIHISRASSMIAELAPLSVFLRYGVLNENDILIIEEPESHLHPDKQARLAELFASIVNILGIRAIITTHSDVFLSRMSDLVSLSTLPNDKLVELGYDRRLVLNPNHVAVYNFIKRNDGTIVERISVDSEGIREEVFHKIIEELYEESMKIYYRVQEHVRKTRENREAQGQNTG